MLRNAESAITKGKLKEEDIDPALINQFTVLLRLGLFDGDPLKGKFGRLGNGDVCTKGHQQLALEAARQGIVLLKNNDNFLPLNKNHVYSLAVIGPGANSTTFIGGLYSGLILLIILRTRIFCQIFIFLFSIGYMRTNLEIY